MLDKAKVEITAPRAGHELAAELDRLERRKAAGKATPEDLERLEALPDELAQVIEASKIVLVLQVATRRGGFRRGSLLSRVHEWTREQGYGETEWKDLPEEMQRDIVIMQQAASISGALVVDECRNFDVPETISGWLEIPDYLFEPALAVAWELNPHWAPELPDDAKN